MGHLLIIAANADLRQSLWFALEAEGHTVVTCPDIAHIGEPPSHFDCVILDHHATEGDPADVDRLFRTFRPIVLLANEAGHPLSSQSFRTILKPRLGPFLAQAVSQAIASQSHAQ